MKAPTIWIYPKVQSILQKKSLGQKCARAKLAQDHYTSLFLFFLLKERELSVDSLMANFHMILDTFFKDDRDASKDLLQYPQYSAEVIRAMLNEHSLTPSSV